MTRMWLVRGGERGEEGWSGVGEGVSRSPMDRLHARKELELLWRCGGARWLSKRENEEDESTLWRLLSYVKTLPYNNRYMLIVLFTIFKRVFRPLLQKAMPASPPG